MVLPRGRRHGVLRVKFLINTFLFLTTLLCQTKAHTAKTFHNRVTLLKLREYSNFAFFNSIVLESYPEVACYADLMLGWPEAGDSPGNNKEKRRRSRQGGADRRRLVSKRRLTLPVIRLANVQSLENKIDELHTRISTQVRSAPYCVFCKTWLGERTPNTAITPDGYGVFRAGEVLRAVARYAAEEWPPSSNNRGVLTVRSFQNPALKMWNF